MKVMEPKWNYMFLISHLKKIIRWPQVTPSGLTVYLRKYYLIREPSLKRNSWSKYNPIFKKIY
jgi:hypothetical protein